MGTEPTNLDTDKDGYSGGEGAVFVGSDPLDPSDLGPDHYGERNPSEEIETDG